MTPYPMAMATRRIVLTIGFTSIVFILDSIRAGADPSATAVDASSLPASGKSALMPVFLRTESHENPLGIDVRNPTLSWMIEQGNPNGKRAIRQQAYQILVAGSEELLAADKGDLWDSGWVTSDQSVHIVYGGKPLQARKQAHWKVRIKDQDGNPSNWSRPAVWVMGMLGDWKHPWIAGRDVPMKPPVGQTYIPASNPPGNFKGTADVRREAVLMRRDVTLENKPLRALARVSALGFADFSINGKKAGDDVIAPAVSDYTKRVFYHVYDVTHLFQQGDNTLGAVLGNGFFSTPGRGWARWVGVGNEPVFSVEVELAMPDGTIVVLGTDKSWKWSTAEITFNDFFAGEYQDLRLAQPGWDAPGFDQSKWLPVVQVSAPPGKMVANPGTPVRVAKEINPVRVEGNRYFFDHMQTGWPIVKVKGSAGQEVKVTDSVKGGKSGANGRSANLKFILKGDGVETLEPRFMVHSIGPVISVDGVEPPPKDAVTIMSAHADLRLTGSFSCSNPFLNHVYDATLRTHLNYTLDIPMDPTREKAGWLQDVQTMVDSTVYLTDMDAVYRRWWADMLESQLPDGSVGSVAPMIWGGQENCWNDPWWGGMIVYLPYKHYLYYGNKELLETAYEPMAKYLKWLTGKVDPKDGLLHWAGASDWIEVGIDGWGPPKRTPTHLVSTCALYHYTDTMSRISQTLGRTEAATAYAADALKIRDHFNTRLFDPTTGIYAGAKDSQTSLILPLALGMVPDDKKDLVIQRLADNIRQRGNHLSTGFVGTPTLMDSMARIGLGDLLYKIINQQDYPSWNTLIADGVMKETWRGGLVQMPSLGGSIGQWFYKVAAGIRPDPAAPGFKHIIIDPSIAGDLTWVKCDFDSGYGRITSNWDRKGDNLTMDVTIPPNTTATVYVPTNNAEGVTESGRSGRSASQSEGVEFLRMENNTAVYEIGSGRYQFRSRNSSRVPN